MALFNWSEGYSVGVIKLDMQHRRLVAMVNKLYDSMSDPNGSKLCGQLLRELVAYTKEHFAAEELMMVQAGYPLVAEHKNKHAELISSVDGFVRDFTNGNQQIKVKLMMFLKDWLTQHILKTDKLYSEALAANATAR